MAVWIHVRVIVIVVIVDPTGGTPSQQGGGSSITLSHNSGIMWSRHGRGRSAFALSQRFLVLFCHEKLTTEQKHKCMFMAQGKWTSFGGFPLSTLPREAGPSERVWSAWCMGCHTGSCEAQPLCCLLPPGFACMANMSATQPNLLPQNGSQFASVVSPVSSLGFKFTLLFWIQFTHRREVGDAGPFQALSEELLSQHNWSCPKPIQKTVTFFQSDLQPRKFMGWKEDVLSWTELFFECSFARRVFAYWFTPKYVLTHFSCLLYVVFTLGARASRH